jgi:hypothetical protein
LSIDIHNADKEQITTWGRMFNGELKKYRAKFIHDSNFGYSVEFETKEDLLAFKLKFS